MNIVDPLTKGLYTKVVLVPARGMSLKPMGEGIMMDTYLEWIF